MSGKSREQMEQILLASVLNTDQNENFKDKVLK